MTWDDIIEQVARQIHAGTLSGPISPEMVTRAANDLMEGAFKGYGKNFETPGIGAVDFEQLQAIEQNVFVFSGFKNYNQLKEVSLFLLDDKGQLRDFDSFFADVKKIDATYREAWGKTEYDNAQNTSSAISRWKEFQQQKTALRFLTWRALPHETMCEVCGANNGTHLPVDHPWWRTHFYPAHWKCYCIIEQSDDESLVTPEDEIPAPAYPKNWKMFERNAGIDGVVFPEKHPYFDVNEAAKKKINAAVKPLIPVRKSPADALPTRTEAREQMQNVITGNLPVTISTVQIASDLTVQEIVARNLQLAKLFEEYEVSKVYVKSSVTVQYKSSGSNIGGITSAFDGSHLTKLNFGSGNIGAEERIDRGIRRFSRIDKANEEIATLTHEFAHLITVDRQQVWYAKDERLKEFMPELRTIKARYEKELKALSKDIKKRKDLDALHLGLYASTNINEFMAESFTEYKLCGKPSPYAIEVGKLIDKTFKRKE